MLTRERKQREAERHGGEGKVRVKCMGNIRRGGNSVMMKKGRNPGTVEEEGK